MNACLTTRSLFSVVSGCLVEKPECGYANKLGFSFICSHPDHTKFNSHVAGSLDEDGARELYDTLRQKRRDEFIATLDETTRNKFFLKVNFLGQPLTNMPADC